MWKIKYKKEVLKEAEKLPRDVLLRVRKKLELLKENPWRYSEPLVNVSYRKVRVGDYRIIIDIKEERKEVVILMIKHRKKGIQAIMEALNLMKCS